MKTNVVFLLLVLLVALAFARRVAVSQSPAPFVIVGGDEAVQRYSEAMARELNHLENPAYKEPASANLDGRFITTDTFKDIDFDPHIPQDVPLLAEASVASSKEIDSFVKAPFEFTIMAFSLGMAR